MEREHDSQHRMKEEGIHWLQDKNRIVNEMNGIHLRDYFMMNKVFLDGDDFITTNKLPCHFRLLNARMQNRFCTKTVPE